jgi:hypothetical protein
VNKSQRENTVKIFLDLAKAVIIAFCIGGLIPGSPITVIIFSVFGILGQVMLRVE